MGLEALHQWDISKGQCNRDEEQYQNLLEVEEKCAVCKIHFFFYHWTKEIHLSTILSYNLLCELFHHIYDKTWDNRGRIHPTDWPKWAEDDFEFLVKIKCQFCYPAADLFI